MKTILALALFLVVVTMVAGAKSVKDDKISRDARFFGLGLGGYGYGGYAYPSYGYRGYGVGYNYNRAYGFNNPYYGGYYG